MFNRQDEKELYFSTTRELKINNVIYRPSICYKVPALAKRNLDELAKEGKVKFYTQPVRFVNGALAPVPTGQAERGVSSVILEEEAKPAKKRGK